MRLKSGAVGNGHSGWRSGMPEFKVSAVRLAPSRSDPVSRILVVGNGPAAHRLAECLHDHGHSGTVTVLDTEPRPPTTGPC